MKKSILLSLLASVMLLSSCGNSSDSRNYLVAPERQNWTAELDLCGRVISLFGDVSSVTILRDGEPIQSYAFDTQGNVISKTEYECDGDTPETYSYFYDTEGNTTDVKVKRGRRTYDVAKYKYDIQGNLTEATLTDGLREKDTHKYDENGLKVESKHYVAGKQLNKTVYKYDEQGKLIEEIISDPKGKEIWVHTKYEYDSTGNISKASYADCYYLYEYDKHGNKLEEQLYQLDGTFCSKTIFKYDSKGNLTEKVGYYSDGKVGYEYSYAHEYDSQNNIIKSTVETIHHGTKSDVVPNYELKIEYR